MSVQERMRLCRIIEKLEEQREYGKRLGLENKSSYRGIQVEQIEKERN